MTTFSGRYSESWSLLNSDPSGLEAIRSLHNWRWVGDINKRTRPIHPVIWISEGIRAHVRLHKKYVAAPSQSSKRCYHLPYGDPFSAVSCERLRIALYFIIFPFLSFILLFFNFIIFDCALQGTLKIVWRILNVDFVTIRQWAVIPNKTNKILNKLEHERSIDVDSELEKKEKNVQG